MRQHVYTLIWTPRGLDARDRGSRELNRAFSGFQPFGFDP